jgi:hypothetical protein
MQFLAVEETQIAPGETLAGFQITLSQLHDCCYTVYFFGAFFDPFAQDIICFSCDVPVPAPIATWGQVKALYR